MLKETAALPRGVELTAKILSFLADDDERLSRFIGATGHDMASLREAVHSSAFEEALVDYILDEDALVVAFAEYAGTRPEAVSRLKVLSEVAGATAKPGDKLPLPPRRAFAE